MKINILLDTPDSFLHDFVPDLIDKLTNRGHEVCFCKDHSKIKKGDMLFLLACKTILKKEHLALNTNNLVIHPSKLPEGRGSASLVWKILEGGNEIFITIFEANEKIDRGDIYIQESIRFEGHELSDEIRNSQGRKTVELVLKFVEQYPDIKAVKQAGKGSFYPKRNPDHSRLDLDKTVRDQFELLRVVDNVRYPAFFEFRGHKYIIKIFKDDRKVE